MQRRLPTILPMAFALTFALALLVAAPTTAQTAIVDDDPRTTERIEPTDPVDFAVEVSRARFADAAADVVVLSRDDNFADSLAGAGLTADGPLLFTQTDELPAATSSEIDRVMAEDGVVYLLGGPVAVSETVEQQLRDGGAEVQRLAGLSRVETALVVAEEVRRRNPDGGIVAVARAFGVAGNPTAAWADSVTAAAWTARERVPLLISPTDGLPDDVGAFLAEDDPDETVLLGGEFALSAAVEAAVPNARRIAGPSRADTAAVIATELFGASTSGERTAAVFNAFTELGWTRGLAAAGLAAELDAPLLAVNPAGVPPATAALVGADGSAEVELLVAAPVVEVGPQLVAELDELDAGPAAPARPAAGVPRLVASEMLGQGSSIDRLDLGRTGTLLTFSSNSNDLGEESFGGPNSPGTSDTFIYDQIAERLLDISSGGTAGAEQLGRPSAESVAADRFVLWNGQGSTDGIILYDNLTGRGERVLEFAAVSDGFVIGANLASGGEHLLYDHDQELFRRDVRASGPGTPVETRREGQAEVFINGVSASSDASVIAVTTRDADTSEPTQAVLVGPGRAPLLISRGPDGSPADADVQAVKISADGSTVIFVTRATNLNPDAVGSVNLYAHDVATGALDIVDRRPADGTPSFGVQANEAIDLSDDGSVVAFISDDTAFFPADDGHPGTRGLITVNRATGETRLEIDPRTLGDSPISVVESGAISGDGTHVAAIVGGAGPGDELYLMRRE